MNKKHTVSGKRSGPPPKRGPNPQVPPVKFRFGGGADMGDPGKAQARANKGYGSTAGVDRSAVGPGSKFAQNTANQNNPQPNKLKKGFNFGKAALTYAGSKLLNMPLGAINILSNIGKPRIDDMKLGKNLNDYDPLFHTARYTKPPILPPGGEGGNTGRGLCPDGTMPPCKVPQLSSGKAIKVRGARSAIRGTNFKGVF